MTTIEQAVKVEGAEYHKNKAIEEMAELIQAINKHRRLRASVQDVLSEMADVEISLEALKLVYPDSHEYRESCKVQKLKRIQEVLDSRTNC